MTSDARLDPTDGRIVEVLQRDGRRSYADIGAEVGMSGPSAHERVKKLEARGVIAGYGALVDPASVGLGVVAFMWITQAPGSLAIDLSDQFAAIAEAEACHRIAGEADYLLKIRAASSHDLERVVRRVQVIDHVYRTVTEVAFSTAFEGRPLPVDRAVGSVAGAAGPMGRPDAGEPIPPANHRPRRRPAGSGADSAVSGADPAKTGPDIEA
jgi:Lrp/AsnC family transcriptional regulator, leucine-responsive regulatory protein